MTEKLTIIRTISELIFMLTVGILLKSLLLYIITLLLTDVYYVEKINDQRGRNNGYSERY